MERVQIKKEKLPKRCEICHLEDKFEAINNFCHRCSNISVERNISNAEKKIYKNPTLETNLVKNVFALIVSGVLAVTLSVFLFVSLEVYVSEYLRGVLIFFVGFLPIWVIYYKISFKRTFNSLLDVALFIAIGGLIASLFGFYRSGFFMRNIVEAGMLIGAFAGSIVKTLALIFQLMQEKKI